MQRVKPTVQNPETCHLLTQMTGKKLEKLLKALIDNQNNL